MSQEWIKIESELIPNGQYELIQVLQNFEGVYLLLDDKFNRINISFEPTIIALRVCDEGDRLKTINEVLLKNGNDFFVKSPLYIVKNSNFSKWMENETYGTMNHQSFEHYAIVTPNDIVDILSVNKPKIKISKL